MYPIKVEINSSQSRLSRYRLGFTADDTDFIITTDTLIVPPDNTLMLRPNALYPEFDTTNTGIYTRWTLANFSLTAGTYEDGGWSTKQDKAAGATRLIKTSMSAPVQTNFNLVANEGVYISYFCFSVADNADTVYFEAGWGDVATDPSEGVQLRFWASGKLDVFLDGDLFESTEVGLNQANTYQSYLLIPYRQTELLVYNITQGQAVSIKLPNNPFEITPAKPFFFEVPEGTVDVELAPVRYKSTGFAYTEPFVFAEPPDVLDTEETWTNDAISPITNALISGDGGIATSGGEVSAFSFVTSAYSAFTPNGTDSTVRGKLTLTSASSGKYSPFIYGVQAGYMPTFATTANVPIDITATIQQARLEVPDNPYDTKFIFTCRYDLLNSTVSGMINYTSTSIPIQVSLNNKVFFNGRLSRPNYVDGLHDGVRYVEFEARDEFYNVTQQMFRERLAFDGLNVSSSGAGYSGAINILLEQTGLPYEVQALAVPLPQVPVEGSQWAYIIDIGATIGDELDKLHDTFTPGLYYGTKPASGSVKVYFGDADARTFTLNRETYPVYWEASLKALEVEANEVRITGFNPKLKRTIQAFKKDSASQDATLLPSLRPTNWLGEPRVFGYADPMLTTQAAVNSATDFVFSYITQLNTVAEFSSEWIVDNDVPAWRGDIVNLTGLVSGLTISSMSVDFILEEENLQYRKATYTAGVLTNAGGLSNSEIYWNNLRRSKEKYVYRSRNPLASLSIVAVESR